MGSLFLIVLTLVGAFVDGWIRSKIDGDVFRDTRHATFAWADAMRPGYVPPTESIGHVDYVQLIDDQGRVVASNAAAAGKPPLTTVRPPPDDRILNLIEYPSWDDRSLLVTAMRLSPQASYLVWNGRPHYVYVGVEEPPGLAKHYLEIGIGVAVLFASAIATWATWVVVGRTLRPVKAISERMRVATASDLSLRVPTPPGDDEIAQLARNSNQYLERLEEAVTAQRRFASVASHELRSPVAALHAQLDEALTYPQEVDPHETMQTALRTTERFQAIIDDLLAYTRVKETRTSAAEPLDLSVLLQEETAALPSGTPVRLDATCHPTVLGSRVQLAGVLRNLLTNAQRHAASRVDVTAECTGEQAVVTVQDDGAGIAPEDRERVFEPFVRLEEGRRLDPGGGGLGLALSLETVNAHGGSLTIEDSPRGARFVFRLPVVNADREPARP
ncbi:sensor histidine kinase [Planotetraspora kaengkrachanensis]|uniref:sensor histidine kinase n=1 Tax=Planotetraspora kaengkrachanensis TaxID=575193 RepID=UPI0019429609|nr:HAMP domain-containing sensor histidine kinase [Planotetraspora kaengkrachanensis]